MRLSVNCTITRKNLYDLENVIDWCDRYSVHVNFIIAEFSENFYSNEDMEEQLRIKGEDKAYFISFLENLAGEKSFFNFSAYFHSDMLEIVIGKELIKYLKFLLFHHNMRKSTVWKKWT